MARFLGIDIRKTYVRAVLLRSGRRPSIERMLEADLASFGTLEQTVRACALPLMDHRVERLAVSLDGDQTFIHRLELPASARKQVAQVLPFEIEAQIPMELDEVVFDYRVLEQQDTASLMVLTASARIGTVRGRIDLLREAIGREPDRVSCGALPLANLANLCPSLGESGPSAVLDVGANSTDLLVIVGGEPAFSRTLSLGMQDLPAGATQLVAEINQTLLAWASLSPTPVERIFLTGSATTDGNAVAYLTHALGLPVELLPTPDLFQLTEEHRQAVPRYAKALALALSLERARDLDLRRGPLASQRRYDFLKEKTPLLAGLGAAILVSFVFSLWSELRTLEREQDLLAQALGSVSQEVLGEQTTDPERAQELLARGKYPPLTDPMPHSDAFDVLIKLSEGIPPSLTHDIEEFDVARGHVNLKGVVDTQTDAQKVATVLTEWPCARQVKIGRTTQAVNSTRQKYSLEFDLRCPEDDSAKRTPKKKREDGTSATEGKTP
ncbi:type IV pilus biogenesis protein PilM [Myxococcota bacterium]